MSRNQRETLLILKNTKTDIYNKFIRVNNLTGDFRRKLALNCHAKEN